MLTRGEGVKRGVLPGKGVRAGPVDELPSSEKIRPIDESGRCIVRKRPLIAAFSSVSSLSFEEVDFRGWEDSPSVEFLVVTSGLLREDFSGSCVTGGWSSTR